MEKEKVLTERLGVMNRRASMGLAVQTAGEAFKRKITPLVPVKAPKDDWEKYFP